MGAWTKFFDSADLTPHGVCLLWRPDLLWLHVLSDSAIAFAYYSIPLALAVFVWRRRDLAFSWVFVLFAVFILGCGTTHWFEVWTLWHPDYATQGLIKGATAAASVITALLLWPLIPHALALPSPAALRTANAALLLQIRERNRAVEELERVTEERQRTEAILRQAQKMDAVGQLTGGIAHDFNNLLTVIVGNLDALQHGLGKAENELRSAADAAMRGAMRAASLTGRLLAFSRQQPLDPQSVDINRLVSGMSELIDRTIGESIASEQILAANLAPGYCDPHQLEAALLNLVINARDAMPSGGRLTIRTGNVRLAAAAAAEAELTAGPYVMLAVEDSGIGIPPEHLDRVFEPFFTTKEVGKGSGLGLSMVYGFAKQSHGHVSIASTPGRGTAVRLLLPHAATAPERRREAPTAVPRTAGGGLVLFVEDDPEVRQFGMDALRRLGYRALDAGDAAVALRLIESEPRIDILFTDIGLPGRNGQVLAAEARRRRPDLKILFTTGYRPASDLTSAVAGAVLLEKPFRDADLAQKLDQLLARDSMDA
jgi:signal transduction histidine kinase/CheY-like chemotaxis protein